MVPLPNAQPAEKPDLDPDGRLGVHSVFATVQGEGPYQGYPAVFVRLAGCNLQCPGCDTDYTAVRDLRTPDEVVKLVNEAAAGADLAKFVVVLTGGEPFRQNVTPLVQEMLTTDFQVQIETNGTLPPPRDFPWFGPDLTVVCSPKAPRVAPVFSDKDYMVHWKYVVQHGKVDETDGLPLSVLENGLRPFRPTTLPAAKTTVMPYDDGTGFNSVTNILNRKAAVASAMKFGYKVQLQSHKLLELP